MTAPRKADNFSPTFAFSLSLAACPLTHPMLRTFIVYVCVCVYMSGEARRLNRDRDIAKSLYSRVTLVLGSLAVTRVCIAKASCSFVKLRRSYSSNVGCDRAQSYVGSRSRSTPIISDVRLRLI